MKSLGKIGTNRRSFNSRNQECISLTACLTVISCRVDRRNPKRFTRAVNIAGACEPALRFASLYLTPHCSRTAIANPSYGGVPHPRLSQTSPRRLLRRLASAPSTSSSASSSWWSSRRRKSRRLDSREHEAAWQEPRKYDKFVIICVHLAHSRVLRNLARFAPLTGSAKKNSVQCYCSTTVNECFSL